MTDFTEMREELETEVKEEKERLANEAWRKQIDESRRQQAQRNNVYLGRIMAWLPEAADAQIDADKGLLYIDNVNVSWILSFDEEYTRSYSRFHDKKTGKIRIVVGDYGNRTSYPERKGGQHNYQKIAEKLYRYAQTRREQDRLASVQDGNRNSVKQLATELGDKYGSGYLGNMQVHASSNSEKPVLVTVNFTRAMTEDDARAVHKAMKDLGLV